VDGSAQVGSDRVGGLVPEILFSALGGVAPVRQEAAHGSDCGDEQLLHVTTSPDDNHDVGLGGLEPPTSSLSGMRSNRLSYRPGDTAAV
jgi:hypothetical protein